MFLSLFDKASKRVTEVYRDMAQGQASLTILDREKPFISQEVANLVFEFKPPNK